MARKGYEGELATIQVPADLVALVQAIIRVVSDVDKRLDAGGL